jgi:plastocyanin
MSMRESTNGRRPAGRAVLALVAVAALVLLPATTAQAAERVRASGTSFRPARLSVNVGTRVIWKAVGATHTITAYRGDWSKDVTLQAGDTTSFRFRSSGRYLYRCRIHSTLSNGVCSGMCGKVIVG